MSFLRMDTRARRSVRSAVAPRPAVSCSEVPSSQNGTCRKTVDPSSPSSSLTTTLHKSWQGQLRRCVPVGAHRHVQLWHVRWSLAVCTYTGVRVLSAVSAKPATVSPLSSSAHTVWGAAVLHASCPLFFDEQLVLYNFTPNSAAWQAAVYFLPRDMLRT